VIKILTARGIFIYRSVNSGLKSSIIFKGDVLLIAGITGIFYTN